MDKFFYYNNLFSVYQNLLTLKEQNIFSLYYEENLSLSEIAENLGISRSAVGNKVKIVEKKLQNYENLLHVWEKNEILKECLELIGNQKVCKKIQNVLD